MKNNRYSDSDHDRISQFIAKHEHLINPRVSAFASRNARRRRYREELKLAARRAIMRAASTYNPDHSSSASSETYTSRAIDLALISEWRSIESQSFGGERVDVVVGLDSEPIRHRRREVQFDQRGWGAIADRYAADEDTHDPAKIVERREEEEIAEKRRAIQVKRVGDMMAPENFQVAMLVYAPELDKAPMTFKQAAESIGQGHRWQAIKKSVQRDIQQIRQTMGKGQD